MKRLITRVAAVVAIAAVPTVPALAGNAQGTPRRPDKMPPGLAKKLVNPTPGFLRALMVTIGSNSRLQDLTPVSP